MRRFLPLLLAAPLLIGSISGCTSTIDVRGNVPTPERLAEVKPGKVGRADVVTLLGTPSGTSTFGEDVWYYISSKIESYAFFSPKELERQIIVIQFERNGVVKSVQNLTMTDGKVIDTVTRETPTAGHDMSFLEQLLGNVGRFNNTKGKGSPGGGGGGQ